MAPFPYHNLSTSTLKVATHNSLWEVLGAVLVIISSYKQHVRMLFLILNTYIVCFHHCCHCYRHRVSNTESQWVYRSLFSTRFVFDMIYGLGFICDSEGSSLPDITFKGAGSNTFSLTNVNSTNTLDITGDFSLLSFQGTTIPTLTINITIGTIDISSCSITTANITTMEGHISVVSQVSRVL